MKYSVYFLKCPMTNEVRYVGITKNVFDRFKRHLREKNNLDKWKWVCELKSLGMIPLIEIVECNLDAWDAESKEDFYIKKYKNLLNKMGGGLNPPSRKGSKSSIETRMKMFENSPLKKTVIQKDKNGNIIAKFKSTRDACRKTGIDYRSISQVANGSKIRKSAGGYLWEYE